MGEIQPHDTEMMDIATSHQTEVINNPLFMTNEAESQPQSPISFTPKRMRDDDLQIIP